MVTDNASNNNTMVEELAVLIDRFQGKLSRARCFAHVLNITVKVFLSSFFSLRAGTPSLTVIYIPVYPFGVLQEEERFDR